MLFFQRGSVFFAILFKRMKRKVLNYLEISFLSIVTIVMTSFFLPLTTFAEDEIPPVPIENISSEATQIIPELIPVSEQSVEIVSEPVQEMPVQEISVENETIIDPELDSSLTSSPDIVPEILDSEAASSTEVFDTASSTEDIISISDTQVSSTTDSVSTSTENLIPDITSTSTDSVSGSGSSEDISTTTIPLLDTATTTANITIDTTTQVSSTTDSVSTSTENLIPDITSTSTDSVSGSGSSEDISTTTTSVLDTSTTTATTTISLTPDIVEKLIDNTKIVAISSPGGADESLMINIPVKIEIAEIFKVGQEDQIKIKWQNNGNQEMQFTATDEDGNGYIDHVLWIVPHLSTQIFEIIFISSALRLDADKNILEDIYDLVRTRDQNYVSILDGQYVRVTFEHLLDNTRDITLFARPTDAGATVTVEVYTFDGAYVGTFAAISSDGRYSLVLNGLTNPTSVFDLRIIGNIDIDYITDPNAYWVGGTGNWSDSNKWASSSGGAGGSFGGVPDATTAVFFDATSGEAGVTATIDSAISIGSLTINGFTGTIAQNANLTITNSGGQSGDYSQTSAATFTATNPGTNTFSATGSFSVTSGTFRRYTGMGISSDPYMIFDVYGLQGMKTGLASS